MDYRIEGYRRDKYRVGRPHNITISQTMIVISRRNIIIHNKLLDTDLTLMKIIVK